jgi:DNA-3-methyladenine glycosylase
VPLDRGALSGPAPEVAPLLLGAHMASTVARSQVVVRITEVEAYEGALDPASHAYRGPTKRNAVMFSEAGHLYCYFVYGMHWCANVVCGVDGVASAVLLRAGEVLQGEEWVRTRSTAAVKSSALAGGPARLARALGLDGRHSGLDLLDESSPVRLLRLGEQADRAEFRTGPRVGVAAAADIPWRFWLPGEPSVSAYRVGGRKRATGGATAGGTRQT